MKEKTLSVILPLHYIDDNVKQLFENAINSIHNQIQKPDELIVVVPKDSDVLEFTKNFDFKDLSVNIVENDGNTNFQNQVNLGVKNATTPWVSVLEVDDEYAKIWIDNFIKYKDAYEEVGVFLPITIETDVNSNFGGFTNESVWAHQFADKLGFLDHDTLVGYTNYNLSGAMFKRELFEEYGYLKPNIEVSFMYEFLLRLTYNSVKVFTIPKFGYKHMNGREGSLFKSYETKINPGDTKWWFSLAKKECYFKEPRELDEQPEQTHG